MKNNPKLILYITAGLIAFLLWNKWQIANLPPEATQVSQQVNSSTIEGDSDVPAVIAGSDVPTAGGNVPIAEKAADPSAVITVTTDVLKLQIAQKGGTIVSAELLEYPEKKGGDTPLRLMHTQNPGRFLLQSGLSTTDKTAPTHHEVFHAKEQSYQLQDGQDILTVPLVWEKDGIHVEKVFTFKRGAYNFALDQKVKNDSGKTWHGNAYQQWVFGEVKSHSGLGQVATYTGGVFSTDDDKYEKIKPGENVRANTTNGWVAMIQHYFLGAIIPPQNNPEEFFTNTNSRGDNFVGVINAAQAVESGQSIDFTSTIYIGPKIQQNLAEIAPNLDKTVDYGLFFLIAQPMFWVLNAIHKVLGNWGWSIILMTILIKLLFFAPSAWAYKSMAKMRRLGPDMQRIKERYGDDRQGASVAMMDLYKKEKVNPASGCLPMLLQIPFFISFYWVLVESVELRHAPWIFWIHDLSARDPYFILPIINAALMFMQQKLNPPPPDPMQAKVMMMLPLIFGFMFMWFPAGLVLYWTVSNGFGIIQQYVMNKRYGEKPEVQHAKAAND